MQSHSTLTDRIVSRLWLGMFLVYTTLVVALGVGIGVASL